LWNARIKAGCEEHGIGIISFKDSLSKCDIQLNKKVLADLAIWEPSSFKVNKYQNILMFSCNVDLIFL